MGDAYTHGALTSDFVMARPWRLYTPFFDVACDELWCLADGSIGGYHNADESGWLIDCGVLCFTGHDGEIRTRFDIPSTETIRVVLRGAYKGIASLVLTLERRGWSQRVPEGLAHLHLVPGLVADQLQALGLVPDAVIELFRGTHDRPTPRVSVEGTPENIVGYITASYDCASFAYDLIGERLTTTDIFTAGRARCVATLTRDNRGEGSYQHLPFFYQFRNDTGDVWWMISQNVTGRLDVIYVPHLGLAITPYAEWSLEAVTILVRELEIAADRAGTHEGAACSVVGVLDLIDGHGHQLINQLPALQRLLDDGLGQRVSEIWLVGTEFFGPVEAIFPEFSGRIRRFGSRWQMAAALHDGSMRALLLGSTGAQSALLDRLRGVAMGTAPRAVRVPQPRHPLIAFTVRGNGPVCRNLTDLVVQTVTTLLADYPNIGIVLDGWVLPESRLLARSPQFTLWHSDFYRGAIHAEFEVVRDIHARLPSGVLVRSLIGETMLSSVAGLHDVDCYVSHVGTLQHKVSFVTQAPGVIHGPTRQLSDVEHGHYTAERGYAPVVLSMDSVEDIEVMSERGERFHDYIVTDMPAVIETLRGLIQQVAADRMKPQTAAGDDAA